MTDKIRKLFFRFDTLDKKPKLYNIAAISVIAVICIAWLLYEDAGRYAGAVSIVILLYFLAVQILLIRAFFRQLRYNPYSYNTIYYMGFSVFLMFVLISSIILNVGAFLHSEQHSIDKILLLLLHSARNYMLLSFPFILVFSAALFVSNISLIRHEGKRFVNILGIILSFFLLAGEAFLYIYNSRIPAGLTPGQLRFRVLFGSLFAAVYLYFECMIIGAIVADTIAACYEPGPDKDYLIILGCGLRKDGTPTPLLKARADKALAFSRRQKELTGREPVFIASGGRGPDEIIPESTAIKRYLMENGISGSRIVEEDASTDTFENMRFSKDRIMEQGSPGKVAFCTTNYHVFRSGLYARRVKMRAVGMGAKTKWYFWPNASVREFVGLLTEHRGKQLLIFGGMIAIYTILTFFAYR